MKPRFVTKRRLKPPGEDLRRSLCESSLPDRTGRQVYVGAVSWSPHYEKRREAADDLFAGRLTGARARGFVRATHARFLFADCRKLHDLTAELRPMLQETRRFGCATIWVLKPRPDMALAGKPDA